MDTNSPLLSSIILGISIALFALVSLAGASISSVRRERLQRLTMFRNTDMAAQNQKLLQSLTLIVQNAENPEFLVPYLERLGKAHVTYGAKAAHYDAVGDCLLRALTVTAGRMWNEELTVAWSEAYSTAAGIMKRSTGEPGRAQTSRPGVA